MNTRSRSFESKSDSGESKSDSGESKEDFDSDSDLEIPHPAPDENGLRVGISEIKDNGRLMLGCFVTQDYECDDVIAEYTGEELTREELDERYADVNPTYVMEVNANKYIDASDPEQSNNTRYINTLRQNQMNGHIFNCRCRLRGRRIQVVAIEDIEAGDELFVDYGDEFSVE